MTETTARSSRQKFGDLASGAQEFLNSKSMLTPGVAGALTLMIATTLGVQFGLPANWTTLGLSFLLGVVVFQDKNTAQLQRVPLYVLNSLIIFSVAVGANTTGRAVSGAAESDDQAREAAAKQEVVAKVQAEFERQAAATTAQLQQLEAKVQELSTSPQLKAEVAQSIVDVRDRKESERQALARIASETVRPPKPTSTQRVFRKIFR
jgi:uncharacterized membrane protein